jgi:hypothetical protein
VDVAGGQSRFRLPIAYFVLFSGKATILITAPCIVYATPPRLLGETKARMRITQTVV